MSIHQTRFRRLRFVALLAATVVSWSSRFAIAGVTTVGAVTPIPPAGGGVATTQLIVGAGTDDTSTNIWGWVSVDNGTLLQYGSLIVGDNEGFFGQINVSGNFLTGTNTKLNLSSQGTGTSNPTVQIGNEGTGYLNLSGGSTMTLTSQNADMAIGFDTTGVGYVTVSDLATILTAPETLVVGQSGYGSLSILNRAIVRTQQNSRSNFVSIGRNASGVGNVLVDGLGSILQVASSLRVGDSGLGTLTVTHGAMVNVIDGTTPVIGPPPPFMSIGTTATGVGTAIIDGIGSRLQVRRDLQIGVVGQGSLKISNGGVLQIVDNPPTTSTILVGSFGRIDLDGGTLAGSTPDPAPTPAIFGTVVNGYLGGSGLVRGTVQVNENAFLEAHSGDMLRFDSAVSNQGSVTIDGGEMQFNMQFANNAAVGPIAPGRVSVENGGTVRFTQLLTNNGVISSAHGATNFHGKIDNPGNIVVARDTVATFYDAVNNTGTLTVKPGGNALFLTDLVFVGLSVLQLGVDSADESDNSSQITSGGVITLGGTLEVTLEGGYAPLVGKSVDLLSASGGIVGSFDSIILPLASNDLEVGVLYGPSGVSMEVKLADLSTGGVPGDYNNDGTVDAADYSVWRDGLGSATSLPNDDTPGVGSDDYMRWKTHFGETKSVGAGSISFGPPLVPEPSSCLLAFIGLASLLGRRISFPRR